MLAAFALLLAAQPAVPPPPTAKLIIAHRGASGWLPEHTLEAYAAAYAMGADVIEPDVHLTRDGIPICLHDTLESVTDVATKFPNRARADGKWHAIDFDLAELKTLEMTGRRGARLSGLEIATLEEMIQLVHHLNLVTGRDVGIIPEPKHPAFHLEEGQPIEAPVLDVLAEFGYDDATDNAIIQCFDFESLARMRELGTRLRLVFLTSTPLVPADLDRMRPVIDGIGPNFALIEPGGVPVTDAALVREAKARGLTVWPWTFQADETQIRRFLYTYGVDGVFTNFPDAGIRARDLGPL